MRHRRGSSTVSQSIFFHMTIATKTRARAEMMQNVQKRAFILALQPTALLLPRESSANFWSTQVLHMRKNE